MKKKIAFRSTCPISTMLDITGDKWSLLIVRDLAFKGKNTYGDFLKAGEGIATNVLADKLTQLEIGGIVTKERHPQSKAKVLYRLTKKGIDLIPALVEIILWSEKYHHVHEQAVSFAWQVRRDKIGMTKMLMDGAKKIEL
ncbi:MAG: helix-turn-helix transcriptional regulator [Bacteroidetes bacterium]|nr:helix-turn-helix transcriptional regulator [Bacteroidota bacterium]